jgi:probable HAF family extracellular repeat protein
MDPLYGSITPLGTNPINQAIGSAIAFGSEATVAGYSDTDAGSRHAFQWTLSGGTVDIGTLPGPATGGSDAYGISDDASAIVGGSNVGAGSPGIGPPFHAFRWTASDRTMRDLGALNNANATSAAYAANGDGSVVVGQSFIAQVTSTDHAFRWVLTPGTTGGVMTDIDGRSGASSGAYAVSTDGLTVVGGANPSGSDPGGTQAFLWTQPTGMVNLGVLPGDKASVATGVNGDGSVVVGYSSPVEATNPRIGLKLSVPARAFRWTQATGMQDLTAIVNAAGINPGGLTLTTVVSVSRDGQFIGGNGTDAQGNSAPYSLQYCGGPCASSLVGAILPSSRSVEVGGGPATAFATMINNGPITLNSCSVTPPPGGVAANFTYQTTDPKTNAPTGTPNTPVSIAPGKSQSFVISFAPTAAFAPANAVLAFDCLGQIAATPLSGLNTLLISASTTPVPDVVALAASGDPGIVDIPGANGSGDFAVATVNVGAGSAITATASTGSATLPVTINLCQTDPSSGACISPIGPSVMTTIAANATPTFGIFVSGAGTVPFDPANNRIFVQFADANGVVRGSTSVAVRTQ